MSKNHHDLFTVILGGSCLLIGLGMGVMLGDRSSVDEGALQNSLHEDSENLVSKSTSAQPKLQSEALQQSKASVSRLQESLALAETERDEYKAILEKYGLLPVKPEEVEKRLIKLREKLTEARKNENGREMLSVLHDLQKLGESAYPEAIELAIELKQSMEKDGNPYNIAFRDYYTSFYTDTLLFALDNPETIDQNFRSTAVNSLAWQLGQNTVSKLGEYLGTESDPGVLSSLINVIGDTKTPEAVSTLISQVDRFVGDDEQLINIADSLGDLGYLEAVPTLESLTISASPTVAESARLSLRSINPPATGVMVVKLSPDSALINLGLGAGSILTHYNGQVVSNTSALWQASRNTTGQAEIDVTVIGPDNSPRVIKIPGGSLMGVQDYRDVMQK